MHNYYDSHQPLQGTFVPVVEYSESDKSEMETEGLAIGCIVCGKPICLDCWECHNPNCVQYIACED